ncbi:hypothetical protein J3R30DRAFT_2899744 [Lentinula aciculospora]|uniref:DUF6533 domain-containing protein n=1 Tax=Lentinula aciculospora TaxID=153920 RepID=A0A9W9DP66_9AGAR|nr:hypothetical protein J3R30DRAFT_2899744 [Lentinula aciculospora]
MSELNVAEVQIQVNWNHYVELFEFVILVYDYLLTLDLEIERFWKRDVKRLASILYFVNRYLTLLGNIPLVLFFFWPDPILRYPNVSSFVCLLVCPCNFSTQGRGALDLFAQTLIFAVQLNISVLFILRMHAIYGGSKRIAVFLSVVLTAMVVNDAVELYLADRSGPDTVDPSSVSVQVGTIPSFSNTQGLYLAYLWIGIFVDGYISGGIGTVVMRDGLMYFGIITLATLANIMAFAFGTEFTKGLLPVFTNIISSVMMSRLMLNLREDHPNETQISGLIFANHTTHEPGTVLPESEYELSHRRTARTDSDR